MELIKDGKLLTESELKEQAIELMVEALESEIDEDTAFDIVNTYRDITHMEELHENNEETLNDVLDGVDPYTLLQMGCDWSEDDSYFVYYSWNDSVETTDDVWYDVTVEYVAVYLLDGRFVTNNETLGKIIREYNEAVEELEHYNPYRAKCQEVLRKYLNNEADVTDLLQLVDILARKAECWDADE